MVEVSCDIGRRALMKSVKEQMQLEKRVGNCLEKKRQKWSQKCAKMVPKWYQGLPEASKNH